MLVDHPLQAGEIGDVALHEGHALECLRVGDELQPPAVGAEIVGDHALAVVCQQSRDPGSQTSERAGDERGGHCGIMHYPRFLCRWISTTSADAKRNAMKLATLRRPDGSLTTAVVVGDEIVDLSVAAPDVPGEMSALLAAGPEALARVRDAAAGSAGREPLDRAALAAPVQRPGKFLAVGLNYADHIAESGAPTPEYPTVFAKTSSCVNGPYDDVLRPAISDELDYEGELGFRDRHPVPSRRRATALTR